MSWITAPVFCNLQGNRKSLPGKRAGETGAGGAIRSGGDPNCLAGGRSRAVCILASLNVRLPIWEEVMPALRREERTAVRMSESILRSAGRSWRRAEPRVMFGGFSSCFWQQSGGVYCCPLL